MAENTEIEWCDHTFNPWRGCVKVSTGCEHCYAERMSKRNPAMLGEWGHSGKRVLASDRAWKDVERWDRAAEKAGKIITVFCASMADVFEDRPELHDPRALLFDLIDKTPNLRWLLLTKRPGNVEALTPSATPTGNQWPRNAWLGISVEHSAAAESRIPELLRVKGVFDIPGVFLSCEPLLGPLNIQHWLPLHVGRSSHFLDGTSGPAIDWVIVGGESGPGARPMHPDWVRRIRDQCAFAGIPFFFKQWGGVNKKKAGALLDGCEYRKFPQALAGKEGERCF